MKSWRKGLSVANLMGLEVGFQQIIEAALNLSRNPHLIKKKKKILVEILEQQKIVRERGNQRIE